MRRFTVGTRGSALALWQTRHVTSLLSTHGASVSERIITTQGDVNLTERLQGKIEKGFFTQELESALFDREIDWAVHSLKDLPTRMPKGLVLGAVLERAPASDLLLVHPDAHDPEAPLGLKVHARVGSSSLRRENLLRHHAPTCEPVPLRGNVPTRVEKLRSKQYDAILLAEAGLTRLGLSLNDFIVYRLNPKRWACAPGQGAVAVQCRVDDTEVLTLLKTLDHSDTHRRTEIERAFLMVLEGGCTTPFGCFVDGERAWLGLATATGWCAQTVDLREMTAATQQTFMAATLEHMANNVSQETADEWLTRRL